jgi:hypothetical protein
MDLTQHDMEELRQEAEKSLALGSPFTRRTVMVDAEKLVWLLDVAERRISRHVELESRPARGDVKKAMEDSGVSYDKVLSVMDLI